MKKRIAAAVLWFYAGWMAWSILAFAVGLPEIIGPVAGAVLAAVFAGDPTGRIWGGTRARPVTPAVQPATFAEPV